MQGLTPDPGRLLSQELSQVLRARPRDVGADGMWGPRGGGAEAGGVGDGPRPERHATGGESPREGLEPHRPLALTARSPRGSTHTRRVPEATCTGQTGIHATEDASKHLELGAPAATQGPALTVIWAPQDVLLATPQAGAGWPDEESLRKGFFPHHPGPCRLSELLLLRL